MIKNGSSDYLTLGRLQMQRREEYLAEQAARRAAGGLPQPAGRFFIDSLSMPGEVFMIPSDRRDEWNDFDTRSEDTCELLPVPFWAQPIEVTSHIEFSHPVNVFADAAPTEGDPS
jgi:hypothetical protein